MSLEVRPEPGARALHFTGDFGGDAADRAGPVLAGLLEGLGKGTDPVIFDLAGVPYMDSAGFSAWVRLERQARAAGRAVHVRGATALIQDLFRFADLEEVLLP